MEVRKTSGQLQECCWNNKVFPLNSHLNHHLCLWEWGRLCWIKIGYSMSALDKASFATVFSGCKILFILETKVVELCFPSQLLMLSKQEVGDNSWVFEDVRLMWWLVLIYPYPYGLLILYRSTEINK